MKIYIAYNYDNVPQGVLLSDSQEKAEIAWTGMGTNVHRVEEIDPNNDIGGIHGVVFLLTTKTANSRRDYCHRTDGVDFSIWKRGL